VNGSIAHRSGVTTATSTVLVEDGVLGRSTFLPGLSVTFHTGSTSTSDNSTFIKKITALHITIGRDGVYSGLFASGTQFPSVSTQIAILRRLLLGGERRDTETEKWFYEAAVVRRSLHHEILTNILSRAGSRWSSTCLAEILWRLSSASR
jgi:hypothetical protein